MEKSFRSHLSAAVALLLTVFVFASCSDSPSDLVNYVPKESKAVMVFKPGDLAKKEIWRSMLRSSRKRSLERRLSS